MNSRLRLARSEFSENRWADEPLDEPPFHPSEMDMIPAARPSRGKRASRPFSRFLMTFCIGVGATLAWQSYGDAARGMIASSSPQLGWLAPPAAPVAQTAPIASASPDQLKTMSQGLIVMRQSIDKLAAELSKLEAAKQVMLDRASAPPPPVAPGRAPMLPAQALPAR